MTFSWAENFHVGQTVVLQAMKPVGVPVHRRPTPSFWKHIPTGSVGTIQQIVKNGEWLSVLLDSGDVGWVVPRYVHPTSRLSHPSQPLMDTAEEERRIWTSRNQCEQVVQNGGRMAPASSSTLRIATWNLRWFPQGQPENQHNEMSEPTDLLWLACVILWMQPDILAVQESLATANARKAWKTVIDQLHQRTDDTWHWSPQRCGRSDDHHIGFLWNAGHVTLSHFDSLWQFNAKATSRQSPCGGGLRPGHYAWVQSRKKNGVDFHLIALHLKSGPTVAAVEQRHRALNRLDQTIAPLLKQDQDVAILGDFNTMGAGDRRTQLYELKAVRRLVGKEPPGFQDLPITPQCTQYFRGRGGWLDHVLVTKDMAEARERTARVTGYCAVLGCRRFQGQWPLAYRRLSDHCPVILEVQNQDVDG